jgi:hypothetical protein
MAPMRKKSPSRSQRLPNFAPQTRTAFSRTVRNTGARSPRDELMTSSTFEVAACCSCSSRNSRLRWSSCWCRVGAREPSSVLRCERRLAAAGFLSRVPPRSPSTPPSRFNPPPAKNGLFSSLLQHGFGGLGTGATTGQGFVQRNKSAWSVRCPLCPRGYVTPPLGGGEPLARSATRGGRYRIVVDGGGISNTLFLPSRVLVL